jgi:hypothetical protein
VSKPSGLWITLEGVPGALIDDAAKTAVRIATLLGITVWFEFNGVKCGANPKGDAAQLVREFQEAIRGPRPYKFAMAHNKRARK